MTAGQWNLASQHLRSALRGDPANLELHYTLAVAASHLGAHDEAAKEFQWVVVHATAGTDEAHMARTWLAEIHRNAQARLDAAGARASEPLNGNSTLSGIVTWVEAGGVTRARQRHLLTLTSVPGSATKHARYRVRTNRDGVYEFKDVLPGTYQLVDVVAGQPTWRLRVTLEPGQGTVQDLSVDNATAVRDDFPDGPARIASSRPIAEARNDGAAASRTPREPTEEN